MAKINFTFTTYLLNLNLLNHTNPIFRRQIVTGEFRNQVKNLVGKSTDVQNVGAFLGLCASQSLTQIAMERIELSSAAYQANALPLSYIAKNWSVGWDLNPRSTD